MVKVHILDKKSNPIFDLIPGNHGHNLDGDGKINEVDGVRIMVPMLDINYKTLSGIANFFDDMDGTFTHPDVTLVIREAGENYPAKIGVFAI